MTAKLRLSPSGPVLGEIGGGFRLRMVDIQSPMAGSLAIPTQSAVACSDGFTGSEPIILELLNPKPENKYRAEFRMDLVNNVTNSSDQVVIFIETSVDDGLSWTVRSKNGHLINSAGVASTLPMAREASLALPFILGSSLGVAADTESLKMRVSCQLSVGTAGDVLASVPATSGGVSSLNGTLYYELEEALAS
jgi:hypothetical protein